MSVDDTDAVVEMLLDKLSSMYRRETSEHTENVPVISGEDIEEVYQQLKSLPYSSSTVPVLEMICSIPVTSDVILADLVESTVDKDSVFYRLTPHDKVRLASIITYRSNISTFLQTVVAEKLLFAVEPVPNGLNMVSLLVAYRHYYDNANTDTELLTRVTLEAFKHVQPVSGEAVFDANFMREELLETILYDERVPGWCKTFLELQ